MERYNRPAHLVNQQDKFGGREVGINHPDNSSFFKIKDNGDLEFVVGDGLGMIFHAARRTITIFADNIKFMTNEDAGLRWNNFSFNAKATNYSEPAFIKYTEDDVKVDLYDGIEYYLE